MTCHYTSTQIKSGKWDHYCAAHHVHFVDDAETHEGTCPPKQTAIARMLQAIAGLARAEIIPTPDPVVLEAQAERCRCCQRLSDSDGCRERGTCSDCWAMWRDVLLTGNCEGFPIEAVDVVYTLSAESRWRDNELRYSLRSLEKYLRNMGRVFVVGHKPRWLQGVVHIPKLDDNRNNKDANIINKLRLACQSGVSERFLFASDDQCLLAPMDAATMPAPYFGPISKSEEDGDNKWRRRLYRTKDYLESRGLPCLYFDAHVITPHTRTEFLAATSAVDYESGNGYTVNTLTQNQNPRLAIVPIGQSKASFDRSDLTTADIRERCRGKTYLGYSGGGTGLALKTVLAELFPDKSRFESDDGGAGDMLRSNEKGILTRGRSTSLLLQVELDALLEVMARLPQGGNFLEIGTYHGLTASMLAAARPDVTILSCDTLSHCNDAQWQSNRLPNMRLFVGSAQQFHTLAPNALFDGVLVDGDHRYGPCYHDLRTCHTLVKPNGIRLAHDYAAVPGTHVGGKRGVQQAVDTFAPRYGYKVRSGSGSLAILVRA